MCRGLDEGLGGSGGPCTSRCHVCAWSFAGRVLCSWRQGIPHAPTPTGGRREAVGCVYIGRDWEGGVWCPAAPLPYAGARDCPTLGQIPTLPRGPDMEVQPAHPAGSWAFPTGCVFQACNFPPGDSPMTHHTLSWVGAAASGPHLLARRHPLSSAFENPDKGLAWPGSPARGSGEQGPRPVCYVPLTCLSAVLPGAQESHWAFRQQALGRVWP